MKAGIDGGLAKKKEAEAKRKAEEEGTRRSKKEAAALFGIQQQKSPLVLILNRYCVNFQTRIMYKR